MPEFSLVMPVFKAEKYIKKAIDSILSQDMEDWELICVVNGEWGSREYCEKIIQKYCKKDGRIKIEHIQEGNACFARNYGAALSTGKYISFFSSDFYMFPGCLRKWVQNFKEHPEADFVYGSYQLMNEGELIQAYVYARPFDAWELQFGNYIDGGFPVKREVWEKVKWDKDIKSLNDWDWWLGITKAGFKGYYFPDITYAAEIPKSGGLSFDSHQNWIEREEKIREKHKIPQQEICVCSMGAAPHAKKIAKILGADYRVFPQINPDPNNFKPHKYKMVYLIGFYLGHDGSSAVQHTRVFNPEPAIHKDFKKVIHWIGSDVMQMVWAGHKCTYYQMLDFIDALKKAKNLTEFDQTKGELKSLGLESEIVPFPVEDKYGILPLPKDFTVAVYTPASQNSPATYNFDLMKDIVKSCPDIKFLFFGGGLMDFKAKNLVNLGWTDMKDVIEKSSCLMRITIHDGLPITPIEFRLAGRDAMTTVQIPYIYYAGKGFISPNEYAPKKEGIISMIREIKKTQGSKKWKLEVKKAIDHWKKVCDPETFKKRIMAILHDEKNS